MVRSTRAQLTRRRCDCAFRWKASMVELWCCRRSFPNPTSEQAAGCSVGTPAAGANERFAQSRYSMRCNLLSEMPRTETKERNEPMGKLTAEALGQASKHMHHIDRDTAVDRLLPGSV